MPLAGPRRPVGVVGSFGAKQPIMADLNRAIAGSIFGGAHANAEAYPRDDGPRSYRVMLGKEVADALDTFLAEYDKTTTSSERSNQEI